MKDFGQTNAGARDWNDGRWLSSGFLVPNLSDNVADFLVTPALVYPKESTEPGAAWPASAPSQASEPLDTRGGSLAVLREGRAL